MRSYRECYDRGRDALRQAGIEEADLDARLLLEHVCGTDRNTLLVHGDREVSEAQEERFESLIVRRAGRVPLQHLTGTQEFMGLTFRVNEHVLIPRQDTEILVEEVLKELHDGMRVLDMCTGSGCILISLLRYSNECRGVGADISAEALEVARNNAEAVLSAGGAADRKGEYTFLKSDLFENVQGEFEFIVSNPPYIRRDVIGELMPEVKDHEPREALDGGEDGLYFYRRITQGAAEHLTNGGMLYFEIGYDQAEQVKSLMEQAGFREIRVVKDYAGLDRVVFGTWIRG